MRCDDVSMWMLRFKKNFFCLLKSKFEKLFFQKRKYYPIENEKIFLLGVSQRILIDKNALI